MKTFRQLNVLLLALFALVFVACDDDDDDEPSRRDLITAQTWKADQVFADGQDVTFAVNLNQTNINFDKNGTYRFVFNGDAITGVWEFTDNEQKLLMDKGTNEEVTIDILQLSGTNLNIRFDDVDPDTGDKTSIELRFIK